MLSERLVGDVALGVVEKPVYQRWIRWADERDAALGEKQRAWLAGHETVRRSLIRPKVRAAPARC
jgi:hypothetical protein